MIHPGLEAHHPENQDDEALKNRFFFVLVLGQFSWFVILTIILPIILASSCFK